MQLHPKMVISVTVYLKIALAMHGFTYFIHPCTFPVKEDSHCCTTFLNPAWNVIYSVLASLV